MLTLNPSNISNSATRLGAAITNTAYNSMAATTQSNGTELAGQRKFFLGGASESESYFRLAVFIVGMPLVIFAISSIIYQLFCTPNTNNVGEDQPLEIQPLTRGNTEPERREEVLPSSEIRNCKVCGKKIDESTIAIRETIV